MVQFYLTQQLQCALTRPYTVTLNPPPPNPKPEPLNPKYLISTGVQDPQTPVRDRKWNPPPTLVPHRLYINSLISRSLSWVLLSRSYPTTPIAPGKSRANIRSSRLQHPRNCSAGSKANYNQLLAGRLALEDPRLHFAFFPLLDFPLAFDLGGARNESVASRFALAIDWI